MADQPVDQPVDQPHPLPPPAEDAEEFIDPRVQVELEKLNNATDSINRLEVELDDARAQFRQLLNETSQRIKILAKKLGNCVDRARPYYDARIKVREAHSDIQKVALKFERANSAHAAAKEMVFLAEEGLQKEGRTFDPAWQEMLNHATMRVNESERERTCSEQEHRRTSYLYSEAEQRVQYLQKELKRAISKSSFSTRRSLLQLNNLAYQHQLLLLPYFEMKAQFNQMMEEQKREVERLENEIKNVKMSYANALHNLEDISDEIHQQRQQQAHIRSLGSRGPGVGAEAPLPPPHDVVREMAVEADSEEVYLQLPTKIPTNSGGRQEVLQPAVSTSAGPRAANTAANFVDRERINAWVQESGLRLQASKQSSLSSANFFHLGNEENDMSDGDSMTSADMLTDDQVASLMLDLDDSFQDLALGDDGAAVGTWAASLKIPPTILSLLQQRVRNGALLTTSTPVEPTLDIGMDETKRLTASNDRNTADEADGRLVGRLSGGNGAESNGNDRCVGEVIGQTHSESPDAQVQRPSKAAVDCVAMTSKADSTVITPLDQEIDSCKLATAQESVETLSAENKAFAAQKTVRVGNGQENAIRDCLIPGIESEGAAAPEMATKVAPLQEYKVVAVQFTVQETVVTPKLGRRKSRLNRSLSHNSASATSGIKSPDSKASSIQSDTSEELPPV